MVFAFPVTDSPELVAPVVALDELEGSRTEELLSQFWIAGELVLHDLVHDINLDVVPVCSNRELLTSEFRLGTVHRREGDTEGDIRCLGCLVCSFGTVVGHPVVFHGTRFEVAKESVRTEERVDYTVMRADAVCPLGGLEKVHEAVEHVVRILAWVIDTGLDDDVLELLEQGYCTKFKVRVSERFDVVKPITHFNLPFQRVVNRFCHLEDFLKAFI